MTTPNDPGQRRIRPGDDLGSVFGTHTSAGDEVEGRIWAEPEPTARPPMPAAPAHGSPPPAAPAHGFAGLPEQPAALPPHAAPSQDAPPTPLHATPPHATPPNAAPTQAAPSPPTAPRASAAPAPAATPAEAVWGTPAPPQPMPAHAEPMPAAPPSALPGHGTAGMDGAHPAAHGLDVDGRAVAAAFAEPEPPSALAQLGVSQCIAWSVVLGIAAIITAFYPAPPLNIAAAACLAVTGLVVCAVGVVRGPRTGRLWLGAALGAVLCIVGAGISLPLAGPLAMLVGGT